MCHMFFFRKKMCPFAFHVLHIITSFMLLTLPPGSEIFYTFLEYIATSFHGGTWVFWVQSGMFFVALIVVVATAQYFWCVSWWGFVYRVKNCSLALLGLRVGSGWCWCTCFCMLDWPLKVPIWLILLYFVVITCSWLLRMVLSCWLVLATIGPPGSYLLVISHYCM